MASTDLQQLKILLAVRDREFAKAMDRNTKRIANFSRTSQKGLSKTTKSFNALSKSARALAPALGAAVLIAGTKRIISNLDNIGKTADKLGLTTDALQELRAAAEAAGVSTTTLDMAMQRFGRRVAEARQGTGEAEAALEEMGIELFDAAGNARDIDDVLGSVADSMSTMSDQTDMNRLAMKLFDSEGVAMVNMLRDGKDALNETREEMRKMGVVIDEDLIRKAEDAQTQLSALARVIEANLSAAVIDLAPLLVAAASGIAKLSMEANSFINLFTHLGAIELNVGEEQALADIELLAEALRKFPDEAARVQSAFDADAEAIATFGENSDEAAAALTRLRKVQAEAVKRFEETQKDSSGVPANVRAQIAASNELIRAQKEELRLAGMSADAIKREQIAIEATTMAERLRAEIIRAGNPVSEVQEALITRLSEAYEKQAIAVLDAEAAQRKANKTMTAAQIKAQELKNAMEAYEASIESLGVSLDEFNDLSNTMQSSFEDGFMSIVDGTETVKDAFRAMAADIIRELYRVLVVKRLVGSFESGSGLLGLAGAALGIPTAPGGAQHGGGRAHGGAVQAGGIFTVGEHGREPFVPEQNGRILSVAQAKGALAGGSGQMGNFTQNVSITALSDGDIDRVLARRMPQLKEMVVSVMNDERQRGAF